MRDRFRSFHPLVPSSVLLLALLSSATLSQGQRIEVMVPANKPLNGHLILVIAKNDKSEPRMQLSEDYLSAQGFGVDVEDLAPGNPIVVDAKTFGYPRRSLTDLDPGDYYIQAVLFAPSITFGTGSVLHWTRGQAQAELDSCR